MRKSSGFSDPGGMGGFLNGAAKWLPFLPASLSLFHSFLNTVWPLWASEFETPVYVNGNNKSRCLQVPALG